jgi:hypothetical protein
MTKTIGSLIAKDITVSPCLRKVDNLVRSPILDVEGDWSDRRKHNRCGWRIRSFEALFALRAERRRRSAQKPTITILSTLDHFASSKSKWLVCREVIQAPPFRWWVNTSQSEEGRILQSPTHPSESRNLLAIVEENPESFKIVKSTVMPVSFESNTGMEESWHDTDERTLGLMSPSGRAKSSRQSPPSRSAPLMHSLQHINTFSPQ